MRALREDWRSEGSRASIYHVSALSLTGLNQRESYRAWICLDVRRWESRIVRNGEDLKRQLNKCAWKLLREDYVCKS